MDPAGRPSKSSTLKKQSRTSKTDTLSNVILPKTSSESIQNLTESDPRSALSLEKLAELAKNYEQVSSLTFITREDVLGFLHTDCNNPDLVFPSQFKPLLLSVVESFDFKTDLPAVIESQLVKLKLAEVMYRQYMEEAKSREKELELEALLGTLTKECKKKVVKKDEGEEGKNKSPIKDASKKNDFISSNEITYEENMYDYVWFYCLKGFNNFQLLESLITQSNLPIDGVVKVCSSEAEGEADFWNEIEDKFHGNASFENTALMQFVSPPIKDDTIKSVLEDFVLTLRDTINLKLIYLNYLRHLKINTVRNSYTTVNEIECLRLYTKFLKGIPVECVTPQLILEGVLKEVDSNSSSVESLASKSSRSFKSLHCIDPVHDLDDH